MLKSFVFDTNESKNSVKQKKTNHENQKNLIKCCENENKIINLNANKNNNP